MTRAKIEAWRIGARHVHQARQLIQTNDPRAGRVVLQARPADRRGSALAQDLLRGLGKDLGAAGSGRTCSEDFLLGSAWAQAMNIQRCTILDAQWAHPQHLDTLQDCLPATATLVVLLDGTTDEHEDWLTLNQVQVRDTENLGNVDPSVAAPPNRPNDEDTPPLPQLPDADFTVFRAECRRALPSADFERVDTCYSMAFQHALTWFDTHPPTKAADLLRGLLRQVGDPQLRVVTLRAVQAAAFRRGHLIQVRLRRFLAQAADEFGPAHLPDATWRRLDVYVRPYRPAVCALIAAGLSTTEATAITVADVVPTGQAVRHSGRTASIPPGASVFMRGQYELRKLQDAAANAPFIVGRRGPLTPKGVARVLAAAAEECGVGLVSQPEHGQARQWQNSCGISIQKVA